MQNILSQLDIPERFQNAHINEDNELEIFLGNVDKDILWESTLCKYLYVSFDWQGYTIKQTWVHYSPVFEHTTEVLDGYEGWLELQDVKDIISSL